MSAGPLCFLANPYKPEAQARGLDLPLACASGLCLSPWPRSPLQAAADGPQYLGLNIPKHSRGLPPGGRVFCAFAPGPRENHRMDEHYPMTRAGFAKLKAQAER